MFNQSKEKLKEGGGLFNEEKGSRRLDAEPQTMRLLCSTLLRSIS